ncbi:MAG: aminoglycoside phosphotransferase family protein [Myxococcaceae bacterium]|nr:aminoglycoside phosphotransferase family protein [Myxococcaceae bacterium]
MLGWLLVIPMAVVGWWVALLDRVLKPSPGFPRDLAALARDPGWVRRELKLEGEVEVAPLTKTVAFRSESGFLRVGGHDFFVKHAPKVGSVWNRAIFNLQLNAVKEVQFNGEFLSQHPGLPAPRAYVAKASAVTGNLCLITEKMTGAVEHREDEPSLPQTHIDAAIDGLAALHTRCWGSTTKLVMPITPGVVRWFSSLAAFSGWSPAARSLLVQSWLRMNEPQTVIHGDARVGNMLFGSRFVLIDWQAVRLGRAAYDVAYFLLLSLPTAQRRAVQAQCLERYRAAVPAAAPELDDDFRHGCVLTLVLLSLPLLSGEASADAEGAKVFVGGMGLWRERLRAAFEDFDFGWLSQAYGVTEAEGRAAVAEMSGVIERRLAGIAARLR